MMKTIATLLVCLFVFSTPGIAKYDSKASGKKSYYKREAALLKKLGLTKKQHAQVTQHRNAKRNSAKRIHRRVRSFHNQIGKEIAKPKPDKAKISKIRGKIISQLTKITDIRISSLHKMKTILNKDQFNKYLRLKNRRKASQ